MPQGTIKTYDIEKRTGVLLTDDEEEIQIDPTSVEGSGIRYLRIGQRVKFDLTDEAGKKLARSLRLVTFD
ncbi:MAG TPA: cold shock domain-containing protein [Actinomycetota bacterium]|nr:cold shock domain-containing protein [Actinomycetota bacterium]